MNILKEASFYIGSDNESVKCQLCPHNCVIHPSGHGICGARINRAGVLYSEIYGEVTSTAIDPIEKKPLYHFHPGSKIYSIGTKGCSLKCQFCQNWHISQNLSAPSQFFSPEQTVASALNCGSVGIAFTYSEPMIWYEYVMDTSELSRSSGLKNVLVTNGYINQKPLEALLPRIDAMNIDLKCYSDEGYRHALKGSLEPVKETIRMAKSAGCHIEITTLVVTGLNDDLNQIKEIIGFIASIDRKIPWHISRYFPNYKYTEPPSDIDFIEQAAALGAEMLDYVYLGNVASSMTGNDTLCPACGSLLVSRIGYTVKIQGISGGICTSCGVKSDIVQ